MGKNSNVAIRRFLNFNLKSIVLEWIFHNQKEKICCLSRNSKYRASKSKNFLYGKFEGFLDIFGTFMTTKLGLWSRQLKKRTKGHCTHHFEPLWSNIRPLQPFESSETLFFPLYFTSFMAVLVKKNIFHLEMLMIWSTP